MRLSIPARAARERSDDRLQPVHAKTFVGAVQQSAVAALIADALASARRSFKALPAVGEADLAERVRVDTRGQLSSGRIFCLRSLGHSQEKVRSPV